MTKKYQLKRYTYKIIFLQTPMQPYLRGHEFLDYILDRGERDFTNVCFFDDGFGGIDFHCNAYAAKNGLGKNWLG